jgi:hypothetical protein
VSVDLNESKKVPSDLGAVCIRIVTRESSHQNLPLVYLLDELSLDRNPTFMQSNCYSFPFLETVVLIQYASVL